MDDIKMTEEKEREQTLNEREQVMVVPRTKETTRISSMTTSGPDLAPVPKTSNSSSGAVEMKPSEVNASIANILPSNTTTSFSNPLRRPRLLGERFSGPDNVRERPTEQVASANSWTAAGSDVVLEGFTPSSGHEAPLANPTMVKHASIYANLENAEYMRPDIASSAQETTRETEPDSHVVLEDKAETMEPSILHSPEPQDAPTTPKPIKAPRSPANGRVERIQAPDTNMDVQSPFMGVQPTITPDVELEGQGLAEVGSISVDIQLQSQQQPFVTTEPQEIQLEVDLDSAMETEQNDPDIPTEGSTYMNLPIPSIVIDSSACEQPHPLTLTGHLDDVNISRAEAATPPTSKVDEVFPESTLVEASPAVPIDITDENQDDPAPTLPLSLFNSSSSDSFDQLCTETVATGLVESIFPIESVSDPMSSETIEAVVQALPAGISSVCDSVSTIVVASPVKTARSNDDGVDSTMRPQAFAEVAQRASTVKDVELDRPFIQAAIQQNTIPSITQSVDAPSVPLPIPCLYNNEHALPDDARQDLLSVDFSLDVTVKNKDPTGSDNALAEDIIMDEAEVITISPAALPDDMSNGTPQDATRVETPTPMDIVENQEVEASVVDSTPVVHILSSPVTECTADVSDMVPATDTSVCNEPHAAEELSGPSLPLHEAHDIESDVLGIKTDEECTPADTAGVITPTFALSSASSSEREGDVLMANVETDVSNLSQARISEDVALELVAPIVTSVSLPASERPAVPVVAANTAISDATGISGPPRETENPSASTVPSLDAGLTSPDVLSTVISSTLPNEDTQLQHPAEADFALFDSNTALNAPTLLFDATVDDPGMLLLRIVDRERPTSVHIGEAPALSLAPDSGSRPEMSMDDTAFAESCHLQSEADANVGRIEPIATFASTSAPEQPAQAAIVDIAISDLDLHSEQLDDVHSPSGFTGPSMASPDEERLTAYPNRTSALSVASSALTGLAVSANTFELGTSADSGLVPPKSIATVSAPPHLDATVSPVISDCDAATSTESTNAVTESALTILDLTEDPSSFSVPSTITATSDEGTGLCSELPAVLENPISSPLALPTDTLPNLTVIATDESTETVCSKTLEKIPDCSMAAAVLDLTIPAALNDDQSYTPQHNPPLVIDSATNFPLEDRVEQKEEEGHDLAEAPSPDATGHTGSQEYRNPQYPGLPPSSLPCSQASDLHDSQPSNSNDALEYNDLESVVGEKVNESVEEPIFPSPTVAEAGPDIWQEEPLPSSSPPSSSQVRSSSPSRVFSSPLPDLFDSPPSSPNFMPLDKTEDAGLDIEMEVEDITGDIGASSVLGKRSCDESREWSKASASLEAAADKDEREAKRVNTMRSPSPVPPPQPKRPTAASLKQQFKKLAQPFRSPLVNTEDILAGRAGVYASAHKYTLPFKRAKTGSPKVEVQDNQLELAQDKKIDEAVAPTKANRHFTAKAAKQFKSPFSTSRAAGSSSATSSSSRGLFSGVHAAPTIQALQARVQKLKQAIKIKQEEDGEDEQKLAALVTKWRTAGRDVAWQVWDTVKDLDPGEGLKTTAAGGWDDDAVPRKHKNKNTGKAGSGGGGFDGGWGYDGAKDGKGKSDGFDDNWGWDDKEKAVEGVEGDEMEVEEEDEPSQPHTLGTMLRHLGIDPDTLGWDEDEGDFVGDP